MATASYRFPGGQSRSTCLAVPGANADTVWVYSPGASLVDAVAFEPHHHVVLLAPCSSHTLGVAPWLQRWPRATLASTATAATRLTKLGHTAPLDVEEMQTRLPASVRVVVPPHLKNGEVWLAIDDGDHRILVVADAFMNVTQLSPQRGVRLLQKLYRVGPGLEVTRLFRHGTVDDATAYARWVRSFLLDWAPTTLVPCHGDVDDNPDLVDRMLDMMRRRFPRR